MRRIRTWYALLKPNKRRINIPFRKSEPRNPRRRLAKIKVHKKKKETRRIRNKKKGMPIWV
jgi:hypothetical protein